MLQEEGRRFSGIHAGVSEKKGVAFLGYMRVFQKKAGTAYSRNLTV
jgi:hypothetical protein